MAKMKSEGRYGEDDTEELDYIDTLWLDAESR